MGVLSWILLAACMLWSALRFLPAGREAHMPTMPYMIALIRFLWIPYLVIAVWAGLVGSWAVDALRWCVGAGIINGKDGGLQPTGNATRAEFATILMRYAKL
mgnify:CR=1 FL=1